MRTLLGTIFLISEINTFEQTIANVVAMPMTNACSKLTLIARSGHMPSTKINTGFSFNMPF